MTEPRLDKVIHPLNHLRICAMLAAVDKAEFGSLRDALGVSDPSLSKYLKALQEAGYVAVTKPPRPGRRRTWVALTGAGRRAFAGHVAELRRLAETAALVEPQPEPAVTGAGGPPPSS